MKTKGSNVMIKNTQRKKQRRQPVKGNKCPACGHFTYHTQEGMYNPDRWARFDKLEPDFSWCNFCGFTYSEHIRDSEEQAVKRYKKKYDKAFSAMK